MEEGNLKVLNLIVKADVQGSVEAVKQSMEKLQNEEVRVKVIHAAPGAVNESDVTLAKVSNAIIIAFNVRPIPAAKEMAEKEEVQIKQYSVIYQAIEEVEAAMKGMLAPKYEEKVIGNAEVRQTFRISNVGTIAGAYVLTGKVERNAGVRVIRDNVVIHEGKLATLKRFKDRYGETKTITDAGVDKYSYNDNVIDILIYGTKEQFNFVLKNVSQHSLKLIWNEAAFVGLDGTSSKVMHVGIKYSERESDQPATTIIKGAKIDDCATPTSNVYYDEGYKIGYTTYGNGWKTRSMLPKEYKGKEAGEVRLMLPIQIKDVVNEYTFVFKVYYTYDHPELLNAEKL